MSSTAFIVPVTERGRYGRRGIEVLASNNPMCLLSRDDPYDRSLKRASIVGNREFEDYFNGDIYSSIVEELHHLNISFKVHVHRLGFELDNNIVIHVLVDHGTLTSPAACDLVAKIESRISGWTDPEEKIFVDICQTLADPTPDEASDVRATRSSIGPKDKPGWEGTFAVYLEHPEMDSFGLTCEHVVNGDREWVLGSNRPYKRGPGERKFQIVNPGVREHARGVTKLKETVAKMKRSLQERRQKYEERYEARGEEPHPLPRSKVYEDAIEIWEGRLRQAEEYSTDFGCILATSGQLSSKIDGFRFDWAIFDSIPQSASPLPNVHRPFDFERPSLSFQEIVADTLKLATGDEQWVKAAAEYLDAGPPLGAVRTTYPAPDEVCMKLPGRTSDWKVGVCNGIHATIYNAPNIESKEICMYNPRGRLVSWKGDSGSLVIDRKFQIIGMIWGGYKYRSHKWSSQREDADDFTYVTPFYAILRNIEEVMGLEPGSVIVSQGPDRD